MADLDLKKNLKHLYNPPKTFAVVDVPPLNFLMIDGSGNPNTAPQYASAVEALYTVAYSLRFAVKKAQNLAYTVMPLEGLWWMEDMSQFSAATKDQWLWTMMIMQPDLITAEMVATAQTESLKKKANPQIEALRFERYHEGQAAQILYLGAYADETMTIQKLHEFIHQQGGQLSGKHHEIYLSDPRKTATEKLKTVIRQPFLPA